MDFCGCDKVDIKKIPMNNKKYVANFAAKRNQRFQWWEEEIELILQH